jgi:hypothetical protein
MFFINSEKRNRQNLHIIENALLAVCFDDPLPASFNCRTLRSDVPEAVRGHIVNSRDETNMIHQMIHGGGSAANSANRWFDMTVQVRVSLDINILSVSLDINILSVSLDINILSVSLDINILSLSLDINILSVQ